MRLRQGRKFSLNRLLDQVTCARSQNISQRGRRKSLWIGQLGNGIFRHMAYPFLRRELRRVHNAMICHPSGPSPTFTLISKPPQVQIVDQNDIGLIGVAYFARRAAARVLGGSTDR